MSRRLPGQAQAGFSLLELLVAFSIMSLSLGVLYRATGATVRTLGDVEQYQRAAVLGDSLLALRDSVPAAGWSEQGESAGMAWRIVSAPYATAVGRAVPGVPQLHRVDVVVSWADGPTTRSLAYSTLLPQRRPPPGGAAP